MSTRRLSRIGALVIAVTGAVGLIVAPVAGAHVTVSDTEQVAGEYTLLTFAVPHGCAGSPTTEVRIKIPEPIADVTPTVNPNWDVDKTMTELATPIEDGHGGELTERVDQVVYTAKTPLPDGLRDAFEVSLQVPDEPGKTLYFPVVQTCTEGETAWIQIPSADQSSHDLDAPAPAIEIVAAPGGTSGSHDAAGDDADAPAGTATVPGSSGSDGTATVALVIAIVALVVAAGGVALAVSRRRAVSPGGHAPTDAPG